jgi:repressor LexA
MKGITDRQKEVAEYISLFITENGYAPSVRDIADHFGFSVKAAHDHLRALEKKEIIRTARGISRSIELLDESYSQKSETIRCRSLAPSPPASRSSRKRTSRPT